MRNIVKTTAAGTILGGSLLFTAGLGLAGAAPMQPAPDGLVDVTVGTTTILKGVSATEAASASAAICGVTASDVSTKAQQVDTDGVQATVCSGLPGGDLVLAQNASASSEPGLTDHSPGVHGSAPSDSAGGAEIVEPASPVQAG